MRELTDEAKDLVHDFDKRYGMCNCYCFIEEPCKVCSHPGNPGTIMDDPKYWTEYEYEYGKDGAYPMESKTIITIKTELSLNEEETKWLHNIMQNPLHVPAEGEDPRDKEMRIKFFNATQIRG